MLSGGQIEWKDCDVLRCNAPCVMPAAKTMRRGAGVEEVLSEGRGGATRLGGVGGECPEVSPQAAVEGGGKVGQGEGGRGRRRQQAKPKENS